MSSLDQSMSISKLRRTKSPLVIHSGNLHTDKGPSVKGKYCSCPNLWISHLDHFVVELLRSALF